MKKSKRAIASILAATSIGTSTPKSSACEWKAENIGYAVLAVIGVGGIIWLGWSMYKAEKKRQAEYANRRYLASMVAEPVLRDMCYDLVELIPVNKKGNRFFMDLCTDNLSTYYNGSVKYWIQKMDAQLNFSSSELQKIMNICSMYLPEEDKELSDMIDRKQKKERAEAKYRLEEKKINSYKLQQELNRKHDEKMLDKKYGHEENIIDKKYGHEKDMQKETHFHEETILDKKLRAAERLSKNKKTKTNINLSI